MKKIIGMFVVIMFFIFIACSNDNEFWTDNAIGISVSPSCFDTEIESRTSMSGSTASFINGDKLGVFETLTGRNNVVFTYNGSSWSTTTPMYWYNGTSQHTFYTYYPYNASSQGVSATLPILNQQIVSTVPDAKSDMLVTSSPKLQTRSAGTSVSFTMRHAFALLQFNIKMSLLNLINPYSLDSLIVRGGNSTGQSNPYGMFNTVNDVSKISYNLLTNAVVLSTNNNTVCTQALRKVPPSVSLTGTAISVYVLALPGTYTNPVPAVSLSLSTLGLLSKSTGFLSLPNTTTLVGGNVYVYQVSIGLNLFSNARAEIQAVEQRPILSADIVRCTP